MKTFYFSLQINVLNKYSASHPIRLIYRIVTMTTYLYTFMKYLSYVVCSKHNGDTL